jgi:hypothetical protein
VRRAQGLSGEMVTRKSVGECGIRNLRERVLGLQGLSRMCGGSWKEWTAG